jgi:eukaryotic-like serine/threonine-protein kinase
MSVATFTPALREFIAAPVDTRRLGPYKCKELLDQAGTAPVFKAVEEHAGQSVREVAVKVFDIGTTNTTRPPSKASEPPKSGKVSWQQRVVDEARSLCRVQHPNVIRFHTLSTDPKRGLMGLVMEFAEGTNFRQQLADLPRDDPRRQSLAVEMGINIASALAAAHDAGIVHCNVKPSNIMYTDGRHKLINFGIAASLRSDETGKADERRPGLSLDDIPPDSIGRRASMLDKTAESAAPITGTIGYVDPVCVSTMAMPTAASDLYSLGATLYECIAGDVPALATAKKNKSGSVDIKVLAGDEPPAPLAEAAPWVNAELAKIVDSLVAPTRDARPRSAYAVLRSLDRIRSVLAGHERGLPAEERGPFPGLDRYEATDRDVFFGRQAEMAGVVELARTRGLVGIVGLSGTGKSSIARAGLIPAIEDGALGAWPKTFRSVVVTPGADLMKALREALEKVIGAPLATHPEEISQQLSADVDAKSEGIVILVDQLEEIVRHKSGRLEALDLLSRLAEAPVGLRVIVIARRDNLDEILAIDPAFSRALSRGVQLFGPLQGAGWEDVVDRSLEMYGYKFEDEDLRKDVLSDLRARESAMPLAQFGLARMWAARDKKKKIIPRAAFDAKDGMRGALEHHADATVAELKDVPKEKLREVLLALTTAEGTRAHVKESDLKERFGSEGPKVMHALEKARLVINEKDGAAFVHDSILSEWTMLRSWIADARDDRLVIAHLERDAARWLESRDPAELWRKSRLAGALELWKRGGVTLSEGAQQFLTKSFREEQKAQYMFWGLVLLVVGLVVGGSVFFAIQSRDRAAETQRQNDALNAALAEVKKLKTQAEEESAENAETARLIASLQKQLSEERAAYGKNVDATLKKVANATSLDAAQKAGAELKTQAPAAAAAVPLPMDMTGGPKAPSIDTSGPSPAGGGGGTFDSSAIERVVNARKAGVKRTCLERSGGGGGSSTKVTATLTIAPNGTVQNVSSSGNDPAVGKCIEQQLKTWTFPAPGETKTVQIPFVFVRQ